MAKHICFSGFQPRERFTFGTKKIEVTDTPTNTDDATSLAIGYFVSQGINQTKQATTITTRQIIYREEELSQTSTSRQVVKQVPQVVPPRSTVCMAYTHNVKTPKDEEGVFVTSFSVYVADKHPTLGMWVAVHELNSGGGITQNEFHLVMFGSTMQMFLFQLMEQTTLDYHISITSLPSEW